MSGDSCLVCGSGRVVNTRFPFTVKLVGKKAGLMAPTVAMKDIWKCMSCGNEMLRQKGLAV